ncbi:hypothetical protein NQZ68_008709 [Dissostichus eleginoides]|nr:hypothetical protein NQZ68_008709 [Dissostichus eleginoides]
MGWGRTSSPSGLFKEYLVVITPQTALWSARAVRPGACRPRCVRPFTALHTHAAPHNMDPRYIIETPACDLESWSVTAAPPGQNKTVMELLVFLLDIQRTLCDVCEGLQGGAQGPDGARDLLTS